MTCNWCEDKSIAEVLIRTLCGKDSESWKHESNSDLCYCTSCVKEYHRIKGQYIRERPDCEKMLYEMEEERLKNHFRHFLNEHECQTGDDMLDYLKVPSLELLRFPYLLFNVDLMNVFVQCLILLTENGNFHEIDDKLPGVYLLLVNPNSQVRKWALETAKELGTISLEDYHRLSPVIACLLKIILYGLAEYEMEAETLQVPMSAISDETYPLPHLYRPLPKKDLWLGFGVIFNALEGDVISRLLNQKGHCQLLGILKNTLECKDPDSKIAFWPVLFCLNVLMTKLESTFWLLTDFEDAPRTVFRLICYHEIFETDLKSLSSIPFREAVEAAEDEITLSQLTDEEEIPSGFLGSGQKSSCKSFFWILPYITTILDLEDLCVKLTHDVMGYLLSLVDGKAMVKKVHFPTELDYSVLKCLCDVVKYVIDHKATHIIRTIPRWTAVVFHLRFQSLDWNGEPPKRWMLLMRKAQSIFVAILKQACRLTADEDLEFLFHWLFHLQPGKAFSNEMAVKLEEALPTVLQIISKLPQDSLTVSDLDKSLFSNEDDFEIELKVAEEVKSKFTAEKRETGTYESPICIGDSDDDDDDGGGGGSDDEGPLTRASHDASPTQPTSKGFNCSGEGEGKVFKESAEPVNRCERGESQVFHSPGGKEVSGVLWYESIGSKTNEVTFEIESELDKESTFEKEAEVENESRLEKEAKIGTDSLLEKGTKFEKEAEVKSKSRLEKKAKHEKQAMVKKKSRLEKEAEFEKEAKVKNKTRLEKEAKLEKETKVKSKSRLEKEAKLEREAEVKSKSRLEKEAKLEREAKVKSKSRLEKEAKLEQGARLENKSELEKMTKLEKVRKIGSKSKVEKKVELEKQTKYKGTSRVLCKDITAAGENGNLTLKNNEIGNESGKDNSPNGFKVTNMEEVRDGKRSNMLAEIEHPVKLFYRESDRPSLWLDSDVNERKGEKCSKSEGGNLNSVEIEITDRQAFDNETNAIRHGLKEDGLKEDRIGNAVYISEEFNEFKNGMKDNRKEDVAKIKDYIRGPMFQRIDDSRFSSKKGGCRDSGVDAGKARKHGERSICEPEICEGVEQDSSHNVTKYDIIAREEENSLKRSSTDKEESTNVKRRKFCNSRQKPLPMDIGVGRKTCGSNEVDDTFGKSRSQFEAFRKQKSNGTKVEKDMGQSKSKERRDEKKSPQENRGAFDYIGGLQHGHYDILRKNEMFPNVESIPAKGQLHIVNKELEVVETKEKVIGEVIGEVVGEVIEEVIEESSEGMREQIGEIAKGNNKEIVVDEGRSEVIAEGKGHAETFHDHNVPVDQNKEAEKKMSTPAFQLKKNIWYDQCVRQQKHRALHSGNNDSNDEIRNNNNRNIETIVNGVGLSPEWKKIVVGSHAMQAKSKSVEIQETGQSKLKGPPEVLGGALPERLPERPQEGLPEVEKHKIYTLNSLLYSILSWHPVWLSNEQDDSSASLSLKPKQVENKYKSYDDYMDTMRPLVLIEFFAEMTREYRERSRDQFDYKFKSFDPVIESPHFRIIHCQSVRELDVDRSTREPMENDLVIVRFADEHIIEVFGVVEEIEKTFLKDKEDSDGKYSYTLTSSKIKVAALHPGMKISSLQIEIVTSMVSLIRRWEALIRLPKSLLCGDILNPFRPRVFELGNETSSEPMAHLLPHEYNSGQRQAIAKITDAVVQAFPLPKLRLLRGPPGTGKTHTLKGLVKSILKSLPRGENSRILICAASNAAVDEIALRLMRDPPVLDKSASIESTSKKSSSSQKSHNCGDFNLLRIGSKSQIDPRNQKISLDYIVNCNLEKFKNHHSQTALKSEIHKTLTHLRQLDKVCTSLKMSTDKSKHGELQNKMEEREELQRHYEKLLKRNKNDGTKWNHREEEKRLRNSLLIKADIICCTLSGAGSRHMVNTFRTDWNKRRGAPFACVIIDEAGQCCEPEAMIPLQFGSSKLVLVGDPAQLPATVLSKRALRYGYGQSLFERIQLAFSENKNSESPVLSLQEQYRMHPAICAFPSKQFYNDEIFTARSVRHRKFHPEIKQMVVLNIKSSMETSEKNGAIHNPEERKYVVHICNEIVKRKISIPEKIGVITPYRKQLEKLRSEMNDRLLEKVNVNTIDGFQGREKDIIVLSCVRAQNTLSGIGFLDDRQRMNVALTRAKHCLILIVHAESLEVDGDWRDLMAFARSQKQFFDITSTKDADNAIFVRPGSNNLKLPEDSVVTKSKVETNGTKYVGETGKKSVHPAASGGSTRVPGDGTNARTVERKKPSRSYLVLPHDHSDGVKCIDKCVRLEAREQQRLGNMRVELKFDYIQGCDENEAHGTPRSVSTDEESNKPDESKSVRKQNDKEAENAKQLSTVKPRFDDGSKRKQCATSEGKIDAPVKKTRSFQEKNCQGDFETEANRCGDRKDSVGNHYIQNTESFSLPSHCMETSQFPLPEKLPQSPEEMEMVSEPSEELADDVKMGIEEIRGMNGEIQPRTHEDKLSSSHEQPLWYDASRNFSYEGCSSVSSKQQPFDNIRDINLPFTESRPFLAETNGANVEISLEERDINKQQHSKSSLGHREHDFETKYGRNPNESIGILDRYQNGTINTYRHSNKEGDERGRIASEAPDFNVSAFEEQLDVNINECRNSYAWRCNRTNYMHTNGRKARDYITKRKLSAGERQDYIIADRYSSSDGPTRYKDDDFTEIRRKCGKVTVEEMDSRSDRRERTEPNSTMLGSGHWGRGNTERREGDDEYSNWRRNNDDIIKRESYKRRWWSAAHDRYSAASSKSRERGSYQRANDEYGGHSFDNIRVTVRGSSSSPKPTKYSNGITEIPPNRSRRSIQFAVEQRNKNFEEAAQRDRERYELPNRRAKLLDSYVSTDERQSTNRSRRY